MDQSLRWEVPSTTHQSEVSGYDKPLSEPAFPKDQGGYVNQGTLQKKMKNGVTNPGKHKSGKAMWNMTVNLHGNKAAFQQPDPAKIHGLAEARQRYDSENVKPPFCFVLKGFYAYVGGAKPVRICVDPLSEEPYVKGFAFVYRYNDDYGFYAVHLEDKTWIISSKPMVNWSKYAVWLGYEEARKRYGEDKILEREALGDWDDDEELGDRLWDKGAGDRYFGLMPVLPHDGEWSAKMKGAIARAEEEPQAQMNALIFVLKDCKSIHK